jgi:uncharacterized protein
MLEPILGDPRPFFDHLARGMEQQGLPLDLGPMDHVCYRTTSNDQYLELRRSLAAAGEVLVEGMIGGRPIVTFRLHQPLASPLAPSPAWSWPRPSRARSTTPAWSTAKSWWRAWSRLLRDYPRVPFDTSSLRQNPPELTLALPPCQIKFHLHPLADTIAAEIARNEVVPVPADYFRR